MRERRCNELSRTLAPSRAAGGGLGVFGLSFSDQNPNGAKDQYLVALVDFLKECRKYAAFEIEQSAFAEAEMKMSRVYTAVLDAEEVAEGQRNLAEALANAEKNRQADTSEIQRRLEELNARKPATADKLDDLSTKLGGLENMMVQEITKLRDAIRDLQGPVERIPKATATVDWLIRFGNGVSPLDETELDTQIMQIRASAESHPAFDVEIRGYADPTGSAAANYQLSKARAQYMQRRLLAAGIMARFVYSGGQTTQFGIGSANRVARVALVAR